MPDVPPPDLYPTDPPAPPPNRAADALRTLTTPVRSIEDAVTELLRVKAFAGALDAYKGGLRDWVASRLPRGAKYPVEGIAPTVSMSDPKPKPVVTDPDVFAGVYADLYPDDVSVRRRVTVLDHDKLAAALATEPPTDYDAAEGYHTVFRELLRVDTETVLPEKALDRLIKECTYDTEHGCYVHTETSLAVEGVARRPAGEPRLTITFDPEAVETLTASLTDRATASLPQPTTNEELPA